VDENKFGNIYMAKSGWIRNSGIPSFGAWFTQKKLSGGGPLIDLGVHVLDLTLWLMGYPKVVSVSSSTFAQFGPRGQKLWKNNPNRAPFDVEDLAAGFVRFANGTALLLETSWASHTKQNRDDYFVTLYGSEGGSELYVPNYSDHDTVSFYTEVGNMPVNIQPPIVTKGGHELAVAHFVKCLQDGTQPESSGEQGHALMQLIDAIYESARLGREVRLD
jgi:predicted dehydrogenase